MAYVVIAICFGLGGALVAHGKGNSVITWFLISAVVPGIGLIAALCYRSDRDEPRRLCPTCGRQCMLYDAICTRCGTELEYTADTLG